MESLPVSVSFVTQFFFLANASFIFLIHQAVLVQHYYNCASGTWIHAIEK